MSRQITRRSRTRNESDYVPDKSDEDEADEPVATRPRRGRARNSSDEDYGDDTPAPRTRRRTSAPDLDALADSDRPTRRARRSSSSDEEDRPRRERPKSSVGRGWDSVESQKGMNTDFVKYWPLPEEETLIKFLEDENFVSYSEHWLDDQPGKKSYVCLGDEEGCPICDELGDRPKGYAAFNILVIDFDKNDNVTATVRALRASKQTIATIKKFRDDDRTKPLGREDMYYSIYKTGGGKKGPVVTHLNAVKARDVLEDWQIDPFTADELEAFTKDFVTDEDVVFVNTK